MAVTLEHKITGVLTNELIAIGEDYGGISSVLASNVHATSPSYIDIFLRTSCNTKYYFCKGYLLQKGDTLILNNKHMSFNNTSDGFGLYVKLTAAVGETPAVDILIKT